MCANFHENQTKTVGRVAIWKQFDDTHLHRQTDRHLYYKFH